MLADDGLCHGQSDAVTAGLGISGSICPVETLEHILTFFRRECLARVVGHFDPGTLFIACGRNVDMSVFGTVFHGIVEHDRQQRFDRFLISLDVDAVFDIGADRLV